jgi:hypothetical protein
VRASWLAIRLSHAETQYLVRELARFAPAIDIGADLGDGTARHTIVLTVEATTQEEAREVDLFWIEFVALADLRSFEVFTSRPSPYSYE